MRFNYFQLKQINKMFISKKMSSQIDLHENGTFLSSHHQNWYKNTNIYNFSPCFKPAQRDEPKKILIRISQLFKMINNVWLLKSTMKVSMREKAKYFVGKMMLGSQNYQSFSFSVTRIENRSYQTQLPEWKAEKCYAKHALGTIFQPRGEDSSKNV